MIRFPLIDRLPISGTAANPASPRRPGSVRRIIGLVAGPLVFAGFLVFSPPGDVPVAAWHTAGLASLMAIWWLSEAIPLAATALLPLALGAVLGVGTTDDISTNYANPLIFMFFGGFVIALAMERWNLHLRIALMIIGKVGFHPSALVAGFMAATAFLSMWVSNTATATMMLPVAVSLITLFSNFDRSQNQDRTEPGGPSDMPVKTDENADAPLPEDGLSPATHNLARCLLLAIAYGAGIGGVGTLIGTPPNALLAGYMAQNYGITIGFGQWMLVGVPFAAILLVICWYLLCRVIYPLSDHLPDSVEIALKERIARLGPMGGGEKRVAIVFVATALLWLFRPLISQIFPHIALSDAAIAVFAAICLFALPVRARQNLYVLDWKATLRLPWGILLLVGGGLSLGALISDTGLARVVALNMQAMPEMPLMLQICLIATVIILVSHLTSNTATAATFMPLLATYAIGEGIDPMIMVVPVTLAASCAFMLPVATPPNAIVFGSGYLKIDDMVRAGLLLNICALVLLVILAIVLVPFVF